MRRDLDGVDPDPQPGPARRRPRRARSGPGRDEDAWLRVNARAFAHHPEQGSWTREDLRLREAEPWFDPAGFLLAWRGDPEAAARCWARTGPRCTRPATSATSAVGEVYVLGIDPGRARACGSAVR